MHGTPLLLNSWSNSLRYTLANSGERFPPCGDPSSVLTTTPFSITPLLRYLFIICITRSSFTSLRRIFTSNSWFSVSKYFDRSRTTALYIPVLHTPLSSELRLSHSVPDDIRNFHPKTLAHKSVSAVVTLPVG